MVLQKNIENNIDGTGEQRVTLKGNENKVIHRSRIRQSKSLEYIVREFACKIRHSYFLPEATMQSQTLNKLRSCVNGWQNKERKTMIKRNNSKI